MQLTMYTDYALRTLIFLAIRPEGSTVAEIAEAYGISRNHLVKVVHNLGKLGYIHTAKGRAGGISLARAPETVTIEEVVRATEPGMDLLECFGDNSRCPITPACRLKGVMMRARKAFLDVLRGYTIADMAANAGELSALLGISGELTRRT